MEQYYLYKALKQIIENLSDKYSITFNDIDKTVPNSIGVIVNGGKVTKYRELAKGKYYNTNNYVQLIFQGDKDKESILNLLQDISIIKNTLSTLGNTFHTVQIDDTTKTLLISKIEFKQELSYDGKLWNELPRYSLNLSIYYQEVN